MRSICNEKPTFEAVTLIETVFNWILLFFPQIGTEIRIIRRRRCAGRFGRRPAAGQKGMSCVRFAGNPEGAPHLFGKSGRHVVIRSNFIYNASRKVSYRYFFYINLIICMGLKGFGCFVSRGQDAHQEKLNDVFGNGFSIVYCKVSLFVKHTKSFVFA